MWLVLWLTGLLAVVVGQFDNAQPCFCKIGEAVDSCRCDEPNIDQFNNVQIYEKLQSLLKRDFFRFYRSWFASLVLPYYAFMNPSPAPPAITCSMR
ncbi:hypothetical protein Y032_0897g2930 [Ancylostoma ceylanicum]|uniref:Uncharacterized protein n=1 Tax=Ancylostoma ceylanicum TaxID=53326 RepID=A0A016WBP6_9BILA|nr:hypothetical protein Y032_0897g2930 [Ancylostoma ceylanicum]